jgi:hypothetical protein
MQRDPQSVATRAAIRPAASQLHRTGRGVTDNDVTSTYAAFAGWDLALGYGRRNGARDGLV